jgi:hypothetical protein
MAKPPTTIVLTMGDDLPPLEEFLSKPGISAVFEIAAGDLDDFDRDPKVRSYLRHGVPVIARFEDEDDARELLRRWDRFIARQL